MVEENGEESEEEQGRKSIINGRTLRKGLKVGVIKVRRGRRRARRAKGRGRTVRGKLCHSLFYYIFIRNIFDLIKTLQPEREA